jgi:transposase
MRLPIHAPPGADRGPNGGAAVKGPKRHQAVSGYWHTLTTLAGYCRIRSYLVSSRIHGVRAIDAIHTSTTANPWLLTTATA